MKIPVIINNRDLLTWPKAMLERISKYDNVGEIIIIDNGSTYKPLLEWYKEEPCTIFMKGNLGHAAPWDSKVVSKITQDSEYYVVTDSDLGLENTPNDTLLYLKDKLDKLNLNKIGLGLDFTKVSSNSPYYNHMNNYERPRWVNSRFEDNIALDVAIDTTFALYKLPYYFIGGASTTRPYIARHYPWELTKEEYESNVEFKYYIEHATYSSSYKRMLNL